MLTDSALLEQNESAARSAGWFWQANGCNALADRGDFAGTTRVINGLALAGHAWCAGMQPAKSCSFNGAFRPDQRFRK
ncbi:hypothetical protein [Burkholderia cenocepacia]|uniref:hypothetical protein n=1 Tax=Burkholderia cenocepacia TaxID=95486 RepID=UPI000F59935F|nr:hypothetical protein [Burkholderia cenocepacia]